MRKALIGFLVAATAITPFASASAQERGWGRADRQEARSERQEARTERQAQRVEQRQQRFDRGAQPGVQTQAYARPDRGVSRPERNVGSYAQQQGGQRRDFVRQDRTPQLAQGDQQRWQGRGGNWDRGRTQTQQAPRQQNWNSGSRDWQRNNNTDRYRNGSGNWDRNRGGNWNHDGNWGQRRDHNWNRNWRNDNRYNWQRYRNLNRSIYRVGRYYAPYHGYNYHRFSVGLFLEPLFFSQNYWISDPWYYRLPPAYPGTRWVRYYDDVLLVDVYTGQVVDVIYDFFW